MRAIMRKVTKEDRKEPVPGGDSVVMMGGGKLPSDLNQNTKFLLNDYDRVGVRRDQLVSPHVNNLNNVMANSAQSGQNFYQNSFNQNSQGTNEMGNNNPLAALGNAVQEAGTPLGYGALMGAVGQKAGLAHSFLGDVKSAKVRKRKSTPDADRKSPKFGEDVVIDLDERSSDSFLNDPNVGLSDPTKRRDIKVEKVQSVPSKRRASEDALSTDTGTSELAALREKVYGSAAANFAKIRYVHKDPKDLKKIKKPRLDETTNQRKSPIVLDLTEADASSKKPNSTSSQSSSSSTLSAALLKRPGIEIIPIPGSTTPISIPSSITVTPVMKSSEDKYKDKKDKRDKKELDKKDKKRRRDDSPSSTSSNSSISSTNSSLSSNSSSSKPSKVQIISNHKHSSISPSIEKFKSDSHGKNTLSGVTMKQSTPPYQSPTKKPNLSPTMQKSVIPNKVPFSPTHKPNKLIYSPTQSNPSSTNSPKPSTSPKPSSGSPKHHPSMSPKHTSMGKPSMNTLKSASPTFSKPSLSPKLSKNKDKERSYSSSPSRPSSSSSSTTPPQSSTSSSSTSSSLSSSSVSTSGSSSLTKPKVSSSTSSSNSSTGSSNNQSSGDKMKTGLSDALTITKVSTGETSSSSSLSTSFLANSQAHTTTANISEKSAITIDKSKVSPPKSRKGSSLIDIVDKLRAGAGVGSDQLTIIEKKDKEKKEILKPGASELKKDGDKKAEFTIKPRESSGLKITINKAKVKESNVSKSSSMSASNVSPNSKSSISKTPSGLKPGVISGPASKKVSMSSLPPIPKLPPSSVSNITATAISPLGTSLPMVHSSPLQYQRERNKDKDREKDRSSSGERPKSKEPNLDSRVASAPNLSTMPLKKDSGLEKPPLMKQSSKEEFRSQSVRKNDAQEAVEKAMKMFCQNDRGESIGEKLKTDHQDLLPESFGEKGISEGLGSDKPYSSLPKLSGTSSVLANQVSQSDPYKYRDIFQDLGAFSSSDGGKDDLKGSAESSLMSRLVPGTSHLGGNSQSDQSSLSDSNSLSGGMIAPRPPPPPPNSKISGENKDQNKMDQSDKVSGKSSDSSLSTGPTQMPLAPPMSAHASVPPPPPMGYPPSPSVSIKIVKSPAPVASPLNMISPHSAHSPCIIDDDLMDEAIMCTRK